RLQIPPRRLCQIYFPDLCNHRRIARVLFQRAPGPSDREMGPLPRGRNEPLHGDWLPCRRVHGGAEKARDPCHREAARLFEAAKHDLAPTGSVADVPGEYRDGRGTRGADGVMNGNSERKRDSEEITWKDRNRDIVGIPAEHAAAAAARGVMT